MGRLRCGIPDRKPRLRQSELATVVPNDFGEFFRTHPRVELVCFNGSKAAKIYHLKILSRLSFINQAIRREVLPSTSPAYTAMPFSQKLLRWRIILGEDESL